jgi:hypothetical protein
MTDLYPHEWLWRKMCEHQAAIIILASAFITALTIGSITLWVANQHASVDVWQVQTMNQPSAFTYAPIILCAAFAVLGIGIYSHYYGEEKE